jgi:hypothetical protein
VYCSEANSVSSSTDLVSTSTYQPRISVSISNAHEVAISRPLVAEAADAKRCERTSSRGFAQDAAPATPVVAGISW